MPNLIDQQPILATKLSPQQELRYQAWRSKLPRNLQYEGNYDLRGLYNENPNVQPSQNLHFTDKYKLPNHPTFSDESKYFNEKTKDQAGRWRETDSSWNYIPYNPAIKKEVIERKEIPVMGPVSAISKNVGTKGILSGITVKKKS